jgi:hypothetical protein
MNGLEPALVRAVTGTAGLLVTASLIALLVEHEVVSAMAPDRRRRQRRVELAIVPLLMAFVVVVVARFAWLSV